MQGAKGAPRAAVIGSGFGGLATAIRLQAAGIDTVLYEARDRAGGRAGSFSQQGFTFDTGPTVITAPESFAELYQVAGRKLAERIELLPVDPFYQLRWTDGDTFDYGNDEARLLEQIQRLEPRDVEGYRRFLEFSRKNFEAGYTELVSTAFLKLTDMLKVAPKLMLLRSDRAVYGSVARFIRSEKLRMALSFHTLLIGGSPFETSSIYTLIHFLERKWGVHFPRGGTHALVRDLAALFQELGGELRLGCPVERIDVVRDGRGWIHRISAGGDGAGPEAFDLTVSNADLHHTYAGLLGHEPRARPMVKKLAKMAWSMSLFIIYFGVDRTYPGLRQHTIAFGPRYKGHIDQIFHGRELADDFSLYVHAPSVTDPALAPEGCTTFYALSPVQHLGLNRPDWAAIGPAYADKILASLESWLPDLRKHIVTRSIFTPQDFEQQLGAYQGNGFSVAPLLTQSAWFRPHNRDRHIPGLYIAGAGTHPGAGVPGVINAAKATSRVILADLERSA